MGERLPLLHCIVHVGAIFYLFCFKMLFATVTLCNGVSPSRGNFRATINVVWGPGEWSLNSTFRVQMGTPWLV